MHHRKEYSSVCFDMMCLFMSYGIDQFTQKVKHSRWYWLLFSFDYKKNGFLPKEIITPKKKSRTNFNDTLICLLLLITIINVFNTNSNLAVTYQTNKIVWTLANQNTAHVPSFNMRLNTRSITVLHAHTYRPVNIFHTSTWLALAIILSCERK